MARILVVDDERTVCNLLEEVFVRHGHHVLTATGGRQAIALFQEHRPDVTLLDLRMPEMDGIAVLQRIRAIDPQAAVVMLTGGGAEALEDQARRLGVTDVLKKGLSLPDLIGALDQVLGKPAPSRPDLPTANSASPQPASGQATILIVDDEAMIRDMLAKFLTLRGYRIRTAQNGAEALAMVEQEPPQMVVLDMYMPGMNGVEVLRQLLAKHYAGGVVALTASQDEHLLQETLELGSVDVLGKPVDLDRLELVIQVGLVMTGR
ncbi:MAG: response regulator [Nitrospira sp.]|nr:response regulator [Nitrospira sp.]